MMKCGGCGYEGAAFDRCPYCGEPLVSAPSAKDTGAPASAVPGGQSGEPPPWEDPAVSFPQALVETWRLSVFRPGTFFAGLPFEQPPLRPLLYFLLISILGATLTLTWGAMLPDFQSSVLADFAELDELGLWGMGGWSGRLIDFFLTPFLSALYLVVSSAILHLLALLLAPGHRSYKATLRALCYASGPVLFGIVPVGGALVAGIWVAVLQVIGLREAHRTSTGRALAIWVLFISIPVMLFVVIFGLILARLASQI